MKTYSMKVADASRILGTSSNHVISLILDGSLPAIRLRRSFRIDPGDFQDFLERSKVVPDMGSSTPLEGQQSLQFEGELQQSFHDAVEECDYPET